MMRPVPVVALLVLLAAAARGQSPSGGAPPTTLEGEPDPAAEKWNVSLPVNVYVVPDDGDYLQPTLMADKGPYHIEVRYNYEDKGTASAWAGWNFAGGETFPWRITPMAGVVFGDLHGWAPGYRGSLGWKGFEFYSEGEYFISSDGGDEDNFFYSWSELTWSPVDAFRFGLVAQHTQAYDSDRDIQRGFLIGVALEKFQVTATVLNPDDDSTVIVGASFGL